MARHEFGDHGGAASIERLPSWIFICPGKYQLRSESCTLQSTMLPQLRSFVAVETGHFLFTKFKIIHVLFVIKK